MSSNSKPAPWFWAVCALLSTSLILALPSGAANLLSDPQDLEKWATLRGATVTPNVAVAPDGTMTADQINDNPLQEGARIFSTIVSTGGPYVFSVYLKAGSLERAKLTIRGRGPTDTEFFTPRLSDEWRRYQFHVPETRVGEAFRVEIFPGRHDEEEGNILGWGAQMEQGLEATPYQPGGGPPPEDDTTPPAVPSGLVGVSIQGSIVLSWAPNTEPDLAGYRVQRSLDGESFTDLASTAAASYTDSDVAVGLTYTYRLAAVDLTGNVSDYSDGVSVTGTGDNPGGPSVPTGLTASLDGLTVRLTWNANPQTNLAGYRVQRSSDGVAFTDLAFVHKPDSADAAVTAGRTYSYRVVAVDRNGNASAPSSSVSITVAEGDPAPAIPTGLTASLEGLTVRLRWNANTELDLAGYRLQRSSDGAAFTDLASPTRPQYTDVAVKVGQTYVYRVAAEDQTGSLSGYSPGVSITVAEDNPPPGVPNGLMASQSGVAVLLTWNPNLELDLGSYRLQRSVDDVTFTDLASMVVPSYIDTDVSVGETYFYRVAAVDQVGNASAYSASVSITVVEENPPPAVPRGLTASQSGVTVRLSWNANTEPDLAGYRLQRSAEGLAFVDLASPTTAAYLDAAVTVGQTYAYRVAAVDEAGRASAYSASVSITVVDQTPPAAPTGLTASQDGITVRVRWTANSEADLASYRVERGVNSTATFTQVATTSASSFDDDDLTAGITYSYRVLAVDSAGNVSAPSDVVSVTIPPLSAPTGLTATWTGSVVEVRWTANADPGVEEYRVERGTNSSTTFSRIATRTRPAHNDSSVLGGNTYYYRVRAVDRVQTVSAPSTVVRVDIPVVATAITRGPYLQMSSHTAITIRWRTAAATDSRISYGTVAGSLTSFTDNLTVTTEHEVRLTNLQPDTKYFYSVGSTTRLQGGNDASHFFITHPTPGTAKPTRIWVIGDAGTADANQRAVRDAYYRFTGARQTDLWLMLGDNAYTDGKDSEYQKAVFDIYKDLLRQSTVWPTRGNHERPDSPYYDLFTMPTRAEAGGLASGTEKYYSFDYGNIHFICLDSEGSDRSPDGDMAQWVRADLANTTRTWVIAFWHHPPYSKGSHDSDDERELEEMRENIVPILEEGGVDLVLSGHSHSYERSFLLDGHYGTSRTLTPAMKLNGGSGRADTPDGAYTKATPGPAPHQGTVYAVAGASGKTSDGPLNHPAMFISLERLGSMVLDVNGNRMDVKYLRETGAVDDYFTILKGGG